MMHEWWTGFEPGITGGMWFGPFFMLVLLVLLIAGLIAVVRGVSGASDADTRRGPSSREILDERFARGEINKDEYEARRRILGA